MILNKSIFKNNTIIKKLLQFYFLTILFSIFFTFSIYSNSLANTNYTNTDNNLTTSKNIIEKNETFDLKINFTNPNIASFTLNIFFDEHILEYLNNVENSNYINNKIIYTWTTNDFNNLQNELNDIPNFSFKGLNSGNTSIVAIGEYYDINGNKLDINDLSCLITIKNTDLSNNEDSLQSSNTDTTIETNNSKLEILRFEKEGLVPNFSPDIFEYYFIIDDTINDFNITAIPENHNSNITINGNSNFKEGLNIINISVVSEDKSSTSNYKINITKTNNPNLANTNLETLAVKQGSLSPEFNTNITNYNLQIENNITNIDVLAIPENIDSLVNISKPDSLKIGDNIIEILVTAKNNITTKLYTINVYRRNIDEDTLVTNKRVYDTKLVSLLKDENNTLVNPNTKSLLPDTDNSDNSNNSNNPGNSNRMIENEFESNNNLINIILFVLLLVIIIILIFVLSNKKTNKEFTDKDKDNDNEIK